MAHKLRLTVLVAPEPKLRPRVVIQDGKGRAYTPAKTKSTEAAIRASIFGRVNCFFEGPVKITAVFYRLRPKSAPKRIVLPATRPDLANYFALFCDALQEYAFRDDSQITTAVISKRFGVPPRIEFTLEEDNADLPKATKT